MYMYNNNNNNHYYYYYYLSIYLFIYLFIFQMFIIIIIIISIIIIIQNTGLEHMHIAYNLLYVVFVSSFSSFSFLWEIAVVLSPSSVFVVGGCALTSRGIRI